MGHRRQGVTIRMKDDRDCDHYVVEVRGMGKSWKCHLQNDSQGVSMTVTAGVADDGFGMKQSLKVPCSLR